MELCSHHQGQQDNDEAVSGALYTQFSVLHRLGGQWWVPVQQKGWGQRDSNKATLPFSH